MGRRFVWLFGAAILFAACFEDPSTLISINYSATPPATTSDSSVQLAGEAFRSPPRQGLITVITVSGGAVTVFDTANTFQLFDIDVPLVIGATNRLLVSAADNSGATTNGQREFVVVQQSPILVAAQQDHH